MQQSVVSRDDYQVCPAIACPHCESHDWGRMALTRDAFACDCGYQYYLPDKTDLAELRREVEPYKGEYTKPVDETPEEFCKVCGGPIHHKYRKDQVACCTDCSNILQRYKGYANKTSHPKPLPDWLAGREERKHRLAAAKTCEPKPARSYRGISHAEIERIGQLSRDGLSLRQIVQAVGRHHSVVQKYVALYWKDREGRPVHKGGRG